MPDFAADLVAVHAGQHQVEQNQVRLEGVKLPDSLFSIVYNFCVIAFLGQIERNQFCDIVIVTAYSMRSVPYFPEFLFLKRNNRNAGIALAKFR